MAQLPMEDAVQRFKENEERIDLFTNELGDYRTRSGVDVETLRSFLVRLENQIMDNGIGAGVNRYETKAELLATLSTAPDGYYVVVNDPELKNNGFYRKTGELLIYLKHNLSSYAGEFLDDISDVLDTYNLYDPAKKVPNQLLNNFGTIVGGAGWATSAFIPVVAGEWYTISGVGRRVGLAFYTTPLSSGLISGSFNGALDPVSVQAPPSANYLIINVEQEGKLPALQVQVEKGKQATTYQPYWEGRTIKTEALPQEVVTQSELSAELAPLREDKPYELRITSNNLFKESDVIRGAYLLTSSADPSSNGGWYVGEEPPEGWDASTGTLKDWHSSSPLPVVAGKTYTLSGTRGRYGLSIFRQGGFTNQHVLQYIASTDMPLTFTVPAGGVNVVFNLQGTWEGQRGWSKIQFEEGATATPYMTAGDKLLLDKDFLYDPSAPDDTESDAFHYPTVRPLSGNDLILTAGEVQLTLRTAYTAALFERANVFNFTHDQIGGATMRTPTDDAAPLRMDNTTIGANHGYGQSIVTCQGHNKTPEDIGSVWADTNREWILVWIPSTDQLAFTHRAGNGALSTSVSVLTHVSGAVHTSDVEVGGVSSQQLYPAFKNRTIYMTVDGQRVDLPLSRKITYKNNVAFHESYEIMSKQDINDWIVANGGKTLNGYDAEASVLCNYSYVFDEEGGCTIYASITAYKGINFADWMITQSSKLNDVARTFYVPKSTPFTSAGVNYDFRNPYPLPYAVTSSLMFNNSNNDPEANPVDRIIQYASNNYGYATGYLPLSDGAPDLRRVNASTLYLEIRNSSLKTYPRLLHSPKDRLEAGETFSGVAYRKYFKKPNERLADYVIHSREADFWYLDWATAKNDVVPVPEELVGRSFTVHEKSKNVELISKFASNQIVVSVGSSLPYGYLVLRFNKN